MRAGARWRRGHAGVTFVITAVRWQSVRRRPRPRPRLELQVPGEDFAGSVGVESFSHLPTTMVPIALPRTLMNTRPSLSRRSMPTIRASAASGMCPTAVMVRGEHDERAARDPGGALAGQHHHADHDQLLLPGQVDADGLGQEQRGHGQVDRGSVEVEGEPGRDDDADDGACRRRGVRACGSAAAGPLRWSRCSAR